MESSQDPVVRTTQQTAEAVGTTQKPTIKKPTIIGIYGVSGCGKTTVLNRSRLIQQLNRCYIVDGSEQLRKTMAEANTPFEEFTNGSVETRSSWRRKAILSIRQHCIDSDEHDTAMVAGHAMLWNGPTQGEPEEIWTKEDFQVFTHIVYLELPAAELRARRHNDKSRRRPNLAEGRLRDWQTREIACLRTQCRNRGVQFIVASQAHMKAKVGYLLALSVWWPTELSNKPAVDRALATIMSSKYMPPSPRLKTMIVVDADRTLSVSDAGALFFKGKPDVFKELFGHAAWGYSLAAFQQAMWLYEEHFPGELFDAMCKHVANQIQIHPEFLQLLKAATESSTAGALILTCGLQRVWSLVLERHNLREQVGVMGNDVPIADYVITPKVKAEIVGRLQNHYGVRVTALGDSPIDMEMLNQADRAVVIVGPETDRSKAMDATLESAIKDGCPDMVQVLLPSGHKSHRLDPKRLPIVTMDAACIRNFLQPMLSVSSASSDCQNAELILSTNARNANCSGSSLRSVHHEIGKYLALIFLPGVLSGLEAYDIPHVQGHTTKGYRFVNEEETVIVPLMRGGEPMAFGISEILPRAKFVHANNPADLKAHHLAGQKAVVLVDSVINSGKSIGKFVLYIRMTLGLAHIRIVIVANVVQAGAVREGSLKNLLAGCKQERVSGFVAMRVSENSFTGTKGTDTGNRLFNTTQLD